jgi:CRP-like cAMP-binding protein
VYQDSGAGSRKRVNQLFKADFFGEGALLSDEPRWVVGSWDGGWMDGREVCQPAAVDVGVPLLSGELRRGCSSEAQVLQACTECRR